MVGSGRGAIVKGELYGALRWPQWMRICVVDRGFN